MVHYRKVISGIVTFFDEDMVSKLNGSWKAWCVGTLVALLASRGEAVFEKVRDNPMLTAMNIIDGEMVDVEAVYGELLKQSRKCSATIDLPLMGPVTYSSEDVEHLYRCIVNA